MLKHKVNKILNEQEPALRLVLARELREDFLFCVEQNDNVRQANSSVALANEDVANQQFYENELDFDRRTISHNCQQCGDEFPSNFQNFARDLAFQRRSPN